MINDVLSTEGAHEAYLRTIFGERFYYDGGAVFSWPLYVMLFTNRSGSNLLAEYLVSTDKIRGLAELLNKEAVEAHIKAYDIDSFPGYINYLSVSRGKGVPYGFKASADQLIMLKRSGVLNMYSGLRLIIIERKDVVSQAISLFIADKTKQWSSLHAAETADIVFDYDHIEAIVSSLLDQSRVFPYLASVLDAEPYYCQYEHLIRDPGSEIRNICTTFEIDHSAWQVPEPRLKMQRNHVNLEFKERYLALARRRI